jgi:hypothetical protein
VSGRAGLAAQPELLSMTMLLVSSPDEAFRISLGTNKTGVRRFARWYGMTLISAPPPRQAHPSHGPYQILQLSNLRQLNGCLMTQLGLQMLEGYGIVS